MSEKIEHPGLVFPRKYYKKRVKKKKKKSNNEKVYDALREWGYTTSAILWKLGVASHVTAVNALRRNNIERRIGPACTGAGIRVPNIYWDREGVDRLLGEAPDLVIPPGFVTGKYLSELFGGRMLDIRYRVGTRIKFGSWVKITNSRNETFECRLYSQKDVETVDRYLVRKGGKTI